MPKVIKTIDLVSFKKGMQVAKIEGIEHEFTFSESDLINSILENTTTYDLEKRSGMCSDDFTKEEMAFDIAVNWDEADVVTMIEQVPSSDLEEYRKELTHAA